jgi:hypothetical protein
MADGKTVQLGLFEQTPSLYGQLAGLNQAVKAAMNRAADRCRKLSRQQICDAMNALADAAGVKLTGGNAKQLSFATLEKWLAPLDTEHLPSLVAIHVFCLVVDDLEPLRVQAAAQGCELADADDIRDRELGRAYRQKKALAKRMKELEG